MIGYVFDTTTVGLRQTFGECSTHGYIGHCVNRDIEALEIRGPVCLVVYEHVHALGLCQRHQFVDACCVESKFSENELNFITFMTKF